MRRKATEHAEQAAFVQYVHAQYSARDDFAAPLFFAVPNGAPLGKRGYTVMNKLKAEGLRPGVSDILYLQPRGDYAYLAIEMKRESRAGERDGGLSQLQSAFLQSVIRAGGLAEVCYSAEDAMAAFDDYMEQPAYKSAGWL